MKRPKRKKFEVPAHLRGVVKPGSRGGLSDDYEDTPIWTMIERRPDYLERLKREVEASNLNPLRKKELCELLDDLAREPGAPEGRERTRKEKQIDEAVRQYRKLESKAKAEHRYYGNRESILKEAVRNTGCSVEQLNSRLRRSKRSSERAKARRVTRRNRSD